MAATHSKPLKIGIKIDTKLYSGLTLEFKEVSPAKPKNVIVRKHDGYIIDKIEFEFTIEKKIKKNSLSIKDMEPLFSQGNHPTLKNIIQKVKPTDNSRTTGILKFIILNQKTQEKKSMEIILKRFLKNGNSGSTIIHQVIFDEECLEFSYSITLSSTKKQKKKKQTNATIPFSNTQNDLSGLLDKQSVTETYVRQGSEITSLNTVESNTSDCPTNHIVQPANTMFLGLQNTFTTNSKDQSCIVNRSTHEPKKRKKNEISDGKKKKKKTNNDLQVDDSGTAPSMIDSIFHTEDPTVADDLHCDDFLLEEQFPTPSDDQIYFP